MNITLRITIVICFGLFQLLFVPYLFGGDELSEADQSITEKVSTVDGKESDGAGKISVMVDILEGERKELEKLKILFDKISKKEKQIIAPVGKSEEFAKDDEESIDTGNRLKVQMPPLSGHNEGGDELQKPDQKKEVGEADSGKIVIKDKDSILQPFGIAENLYKMEEYQLSLDIYQLIKGEEEEKNRSWIKYQIANCYRKLKKYDKAAEVYNEVSKEFEGSYWAKQSQWYIQDIEWRKKTKENQEVVVEK
ncbi:MAG: tetratricopeptide repeat protein [Candidatus Scalindua sp. AMX11]|nr:MAG: tetratricopeptide repeat protein [Candidatus Scalindua sp.]NOG85765.1 tetratricopeptide repeat protein [Planctomycetota bacterium]RZV97058.1 MAG: tetratricopeptide repeat protein [Candidatus Scalindua sp. SCAELEC01]TDE66328.1 MAG: tetratricopeptide repeat protein [Candidatus Scalindua sp. AMX11]GJQ58280.1 MAG: hypothetical protein SCALA701_10810 [Candidatus Scalindua sp.]